MRVDLHVHTCFSRDGVTSLDALPERCREAGIDCVAITDHNTMSAALEMQRRGVFPVILGEEVKTTAGEIIGLFLSQEVPRGLSPMETVQLIKQQGGLVCIPHPFDRIRRSPLRYDALESIVSEVDIIEVFNARTTLLRDSEKARRYAEEHHLLMGAGSDAHTPGEIGGVYVEMPQFRDRNEFLAALARGKVVGHRANPLVHLASTFAKFKTR